MREIDFSIEINKVIADQADLGTPIGGPCAYKGTPGDGIANGGGGVGSEPFFEHELGESELDDLLQVLRLSDAVREGKVVGAKGKSTGPSNDSVRRELKAIGITGRVSDRQRGLISDFKESWGRRGINYQDDDWEDSTF